jgi:hypothetical protein
MNLPIAKIGPNGVWVRKGQVITFERMAECLKIYDDEKLWETWRYLERTRPALGAKNMDLDHVIAAVRDLIHAFAYVESVAGNASVWEWLEGGFQRARDVDARRAAEPRETGEAS